MPAHGAQMIGERICGCFARLGHEVCDVNAWSLRSRDCDSDFRNKKIRKDAGIKRAWAKKNQVGFAYGIDDRWEWRNAATRKRNFLNGCPARGDARFSMDNAAIRQFGDELHVRKGRRKNAAANG